MGQPSAVKFTIKALPKTRDDEMTFQLALSSTTLDCGSDEFKEWSKYMEQLNQVWVLINKENEPASQTSQKAW